MNKADVKEEYEHLKNLFKDLDEAKVSLIDELLKQTAFLTVELKEMNKIISKEGPLQYSNKGNVRESQTYKTYLKSLGIYQGIIKTLNSIAGKSVIDEDDEFDEFINKINGGN